MKSYSAANGVMSFLEIVGWVIVALAAVIVVAGASGSLGRADPVTAILAAVPVAFGGLLLVAMAQIGKAQVDTAQNTARVAQLLQAMADGQKVAVERGVQMPALSPGAVGSELYRGKMIYRTPEGYSVGTQTFESVRAAQVHIDALRGT